MVNSNANCVTSFTPLLRMAISATLLFGVVEGAAIGKIGLQAAQPRQIQVAQSPRPVGKYQRFEATITIDKKHRDPYRDTRLDVVYTRPDGTQVSFWGFYAGRNRWQLRFMPDQRGSWRYEAKFSDAAETFEGAFECTESDLPGMIAVHAANPQWFGFSGGSPVLLRGFHVGDRFFASNWPNEDRQAFLDWAQSNDYNLLSIGSHYLNRDIEGRGKGWNTPDLWPLSAAEYERMETILDDLARRRIVIFPFGGFFSKNSDYPRDPDDQELYVRYTLARLAPYWNMLFNVAGPEPNLRNEWMKSSDVERLGRLIGRLDPLRHPLSVHNRTGDDPYRDSDWTTYGVLQGPKTIDQRDLAEGLLRNHHPRKPLIAQETLWSGNVNHIRRHGGYSDDVLRKNAWVIVMSASTLVFADNDGNSSSGFSGTMDLNDVRQDRHDIIRKVWDFMETVPYAEMTPHQELVDHGFCLANPGERYLVYLHEGGSVNVKVTGGPYSVTWVNPKATSDRRARGEIRDGTDLSSPDSGDDWLLELVKVGTE